MAVINTLSLSRHPIAASIPPSTVEVVKQALAAAFWQWYDMHRDDKIKTIKIWILTKTVRVKDLRPVFEMLFGPQPPV